MKTGNPHCTLCYGRGYRYVLGHKNVCPCVRGMEPPPPCDFGTLETVYTNHPPRRRGEPRPDPWDSLRAMVRAAAVCALTIHDIKSECVVESWTEEPVFDDWEIDACIAGMLLQGDEP